MSTTEPIRSLVKLEEFKNYYKLVKPNIRNYTLICLGINSALRISDLLDLRWKDVYDFGGKRFLHHISLVEQKTQKKTAIALNKNAIAALTDYLKAVSPSSSGCYLFPGRDSHLSRSQAFRIIKEAAKVTQFEENISCHSLRKSFGYHAWKSGVQPAMLMSIYNHSSYQITKRYLGINQDDKDSVFLKINL
ncbi:MAG: tyrosine-type recombinase/integrase [Lachnospiraceae bacterium]|nr:tyrosine-type recombinase/integrase [Lachnospiraceae bacterium]